MESLFLSAGDVCVEIIFIINAILFHLKKILQEYWLIGTATVCCTIHTPIDPTDYDTSAFVLCIGGKKSMRCVYLVGIAWQNIIYVCD